MRLVVIGNGATAVDPAGRAYVNRHTANFLIELSQQVGRPTFIEPRTVLRANANLQDGELPRTRVRALPIARARPLGLWHAAIGVLRASFVYVFFPGTLPRLVLRLCRLLGKPYGLYVRGERFALEGDDARALRNARFICCVGGIDTRLRGVNPDVVAIQPMLDIAAADLLRREFAARSPAPWRLLFVGRLEQAKGVPELIEAAEQLRREGFPFSLTLAGGGPLHDELRARYGNRPGEAVRILGVIDNKAALHAEYERADLFVLPTHHEGFPRVLYEAMAKSMVILTTFVGGIPGIMRSGHDCVEIPCRDAEAIVRAIKAVTADPALMQSLSDHAAATLRTVLEHRPTHIQAVTGRMLG